MHGARERNTLRWEAHRALLDAEIDRLSRLLAGATEGTPRALELAQQLREAERERRGLGPSPQPKMG